MTAISLEKIRKSFRNPDGGEGFTLGEISLAIESGTTAMIGGANGSGKSLLMSITAGLERPDSGKVTVTAPDGKPAKAGLVFQDADSQILGSTPEEDVMFGLLNCGFTKREAEIRTAEELRQVGLYGKRGLTARMLSGGEKRRLAVAAMTAMDRPVIILDEPYANLDYDGVRQVNSVIRMLQEQKKTVIILTHETEKSLALCGRLIILYRGKKVFDGTPEDGLKQNLPQWGIRNPLASYSRKDDLAW